MGKCFSKVNKGQRKESDFYQTPYSMTEQLLEIEKFSEPILEPSSGNGAIVRILKKFYSNINENDIQTGYDFLSMCDFSTMYPSIITNPPFSLANEFIEKCYKICAYKFALLMPLVYLHGQKRYEQGLFRALKRVYVFTRMPMLTNEIRDDGKYNTGMQVYAWFVFENTSATFCKLPEIGWIDNSKYVLRKGG